jgi:hypothetical protein
MKFELSFFAIIATVFCLVACNEANGTSEDAASSSSALSSALNNSSSSGETVSEIIVVPRSEGVWGIDGLLTAEEDILDVTFELYKGETLIEGAISAYTVKDIKTEQKLELLLELNLGAEADGTYGLDATIYRSDMGEACGEGDESVELTVRVTAKVQSSSIASESVDTLVYETNFTASCADVIVGPPEPSPALVESSFELAKEASLDLDVGKVYASAQVGSVVNEIDLIYSGTAIMTPYGAQSMNYMVKTYMNSISVAMIFAVSDTDAAKAATKVEDLSAFIDVDKALDYVDGLTANKYYLVVSSDSKLYLIFITTVDGDKQVLNIKSQGQAIK